MGILIQVTDGTWGRPAVDLPVRLQLGSCGPIPPATRSPAQVLRGRTGDDGTVPGWASLTVPRGVHQAVFDLDSYFASFGIEPRYPRVTVSFRVVEPTGGHRLPLLIAPHSFTAFASI